MGIFVRVGLVLFGMAAVLLGSWITAIRDQEAVAANTDLWATTLERTDYNTPYILRRVQPETGESVTLATGRGDVLANYWTPDGQWHYIREAETTGSRSRYVHWSGWEPPRPRVDLAWFDRSQRISPDGRWVGVFAGKPDDAVPYVRSINSADLGDPLMPPINWIPEEVVIWSPDSEWIYVASSVKIDGEYEPGILRVHRTGRDFQQIITFDHAFDIERIIPGKEWLLVSVRYGSPNSVIYRISFDGSDVQSYDPPQHETTIRSMWMVTSGGAVIITNDEQLWRIEPDYQTATPIVPDYQAAYAGRRRWSANREHVALHVMDAEGHPYLLLMEADGENPQILDIPPCPDSYNGRPISSFYWVGDKLHFLQTDGTRCQLLRLLPGAATPEAVHVFEEDASWFRLLPDAENPTWIGVYHPKEPYLLRADGGQQVAAVLPTMPGYYPWVREPVSVNSSVWGAQGLGGLALGMSTLGIWRRGRRR